jgi:thioredoxin 2
MSKVTTSCPFCETLNRVDLDRRENGPRCGGCGRPLLLDRPQMISGKSLDQVIAAAEVPLLVDFYADWCGPCRVMAPVLDALAGERAGEVLVAKVDTDRSPDAALKFGVRGIPTLIAFSAGREVSRQVGAVPRAKLDELVNSIQVAGGPVTSG